MQKRNVTLSMPTDLIRRAKALAAARDKSLSELLRESLEEKVTEATGYRQAMERLLILGVEHEGGAALPRGPALRHEPVGHLLPRVAGREASRAPSATWTTSSPG
jgi:hypothetical protein